MADFASALDAALSDYYGVRGDYKSPITTGRGLKARMGALERHYGTKKAAAAAAGVSPTTWRRWSTHKATPKAGSLLGLQRAHTTLLRQTKAALKSPPSKMTVVATVACLAVDKNSTSSNKYNKKPKRTFRADRPSMISGLRNTVQIWAAGGNADAVAQAALGAVKNAYGSEFAFEGTDVEVELI